MGQVYIEKKCKFDIFEKGTFIYLAHEYFEKV